MPEMPLMPALAGEGEEMPAEETPVEPMPEHHGGGASEDAAQAMEAAEMFATDAESIAEKMPEAADAAKTARAAAEEAAKLAAEVETAQKDAAGVDPTDVEAAAAAEAAVAALVPPVIEQMKIAKDAFEEAKALLPLVESEESDLVEWAEEKIGAGAAPAAPAAE